MLKTNQNYFLLALAPLFWSGNMILGRAIHHQISPLVLAFDRWFITTILLLPIGITLGLKYKQEIKSNIGAIFVLGILATAMFSSFLYLGLHYTTVVNASIISAINPTIIILLSLLWLGEKLCKAQGVGIFLSLAGAIFIITQGHLSVLLSMHLKIGDLYILVAVICWALYSVLLKKFNLNINSLLLLFLFSVVGSIVLFPCVVIQTMFGNPVQYNYGTISSIAYIVIFSTILAFTCWTIGVKNTNAITAGYFLNLVPVFCAIMAILFLREKLHFYHLAGFCLVSTGVYLATRKANQG